MTTTTETKLAVLTGDTFQVRGILKGKNWKWDADRKVWTKRADWIDAEEVIRCVRLYAGIRNRGAFAATLED